MYAEPLRTLPFEPPPAFLSAVREPPADHVGLESKLVVVIDDEQDLLDVTTFVLENEGYRVKTAKNGADALSLLASGTRPELVLLDMMMPVMNGWEFLEAVARTPALRHIPIVVMTAAGSIGVPGATAVLRKPFDLGVLVEVVERHAGRGE
jgi:CheY-like chemotaxis protein